MELGLYTFAELHGDPVTGQKISQQQRLSQLLEEVELAEQVGLEVYGVGEHHRPDFIVSSPAVVLAAAAARTKRIRLTSAVSVLSSDDPIRVFQDFATLDLISGGRAEIMAGRGSFIESFPLFGYDLSQYDALFAEKLELLLKLRASERLTWTGRLTPSVQDRGVYPRPVQDPLPIWIAVGGTPESAVRAGTLGLPMALAIIGGLPERFGPFVDLYRDAARRAGHTGERVGINSHGYIAADAKQARDEYFPSYAAAMNTIGRERGWPPMGRDSFEAQCSPRGALLVGSPAEVADKILFEYEVFKHDRFLLQISVGSLPHAQVMRAIELYGTRVAPEIRKAIGGVAGATAVAEVKE